ncbi:uncharacterized protein LOC121242342 [Juglans microcarpa x Juglans regia]|uniref:uncharacterized protein LOC121242342 n=1 Tax=Juglans microcarpa x Juglans regia TaxID=2249226 RepID=UPI001B7E7EEF|nr:uncharacterized protein LOC121242342 [Juglans microcarpa x Juglans regia]
MGVEEEEEPEKTDAALVVIEETKVEEIGELLGISLHAIAGIEEEEHINQHNWWSSEGLWLQVLDATTLDSKEVVLPGVKQMLENFQGIFIEPTPPLKSYDHKMQLQEGAKPTCVHRILTWISLNGCLIHQLSKYGHFMAITHPYIAMTVARAFMENAFKLHGFPQTIVSDRDLVFTSHFWKELLKICGTNVLLSTTYHPQTDGQIEATNKEAQSKMKFFADLKWTDKEYKEVDFVYLMMCPYRQLLVAMCRNLKIVLQYYGPFKIIWRVGKVVYELDLPPKSCIYPIFHILCLKRKLGNGIQPNANLPIVTREGAIAPKLEKILQIRLKQRGNTANVDVLVQWCRKGEEDATWEDLSTLQ